MTVKTSHLVVNTSNLSGEDLSNFLNISEEIRQRQNQRSNNINTFAMKAKMTREEIFECSTLDADNEDFLTALEQNSQRNSFATSPAHLQATFSQSFKSLLRYFDEDVNVHINTDSRRETLVETTKQQQQYDIEQSPAIVSFNDSIANLTSSSPLQATTTTTTTTNRAAVVFDINGRYSPTVKELRAIYEHRNAAFEWSPKKDDANASSRRLLQKSKVKQMVQLFNAKITQWMRRESLELPHHHLHNELSPERIKNSTPMFAKPQPKPRTRFTVSLARKTETETEAEEQETTAITLLHCSKDSPVASIHSSTTITDGGESLTENVFGQLSVKDKILLYNRFAEDMSKKHPQFSRQAANIKDRANRVFGRGEVVAERQLTVRQLKNRLEAQLHHHDDQTKKKQPIMMQPPPLPTQPPPPPPSSSSSLTPLSSFNPDDAMKSLNNTSIDSLHVSSYAVVLKPSPEVPRSLLRSKFLDARPRNVEFLEDACIVAEAPTSKRNKDEMSSCLPIEAFAPPRKIRRTRTERLAPKTFFENEHMVRLFFRWLKERNGIAFDITPRQQTTTTATSKDTNIVDQLLEETITKLHKIDLLEKKQKIEEGDGNGDGDGDDDLKDTVMMTDLSAPMALPRKSIERRSMSDHFALRSASISSLVTSESSLVTSTVEDSESGLSSMPKITSDSSQRDYINKKKKKHLHNVASTEEDEVEEAEDDDDDDGDNDHRDFVLATKSPRKRKKKSKKDNANKLLSLSFESIELPTSDSDVDTRPRFLEKSRRTLHASLTRPAAGPGRGSDTNCGGLDGTLMRVMNSPRKIRTAYTLTVMSSPSPHPDSDYYCDTDAQRRRQSSTVERTMTSAAMMMATTKQRSRSWPSLLTKVATTTTTTTTESWSVQSPQLYVNVDNYQDDQGFVTGTNTPENSPVLLPAQTPPLKINRFALPLFVKLTTELEESHMRRLSRSSIRNGDHGDDHFCLQFPSPKKNPTTNIVEKRRSSSGDGGSNATTTSSFSLLMPPPPPPETTTALSAHKTRRRSVIYDADARRSSVTMQVIEEDRPLSYDGINRPSMASTGGDAATNDVDGICKEKSSSFWIVAGDITISIDIFYNTNNRLRLLYDIFRQKIGESACDIHFGIDDNKFSLNNPSDKESISRRLPREKNCSHYWFSSGDLAFPFSGKYMSETRVKRLFSFISENITKSSSSPPSRLRFGVDEFEFSTVADERSSSVPKFSIDSNYSMLIGLQGGNSSGIEGRSKSAWPNTRRTSANGLDWGGATSKVATSPNCSGYEAFPIEFETPRFSDTFQAFDYESEALDQLFTEPSIKAMPRGMQQQQNVVANNNNNNLTSTTTTTTTTTPILPKTKTLDSLIRSYTRFSQLPRDSTGQLINMTEQMSDMQTIIAAINDISQDGGFVDCSLKQLKAFAFFLGEYADMSFSICGFHIDLIEEALLRQRLMTKVA